LPCALPIVNVDSGKAVLGKNFGKKILPRVWPSVYRVSKYDKIKIQ
jgi:hypothetical protein